MEIKLYFPKSYSEGPISQPTCMQSLKGFLSVFFKLVVNSRSGGGVLLTWKNVLFPLFSFSDMARGRCILGFFLFF